MRFKKKSFDFPDGQIERGAFGNAPYMSASEIATAGCASLVKSF